MRSKQLLLGHGGGGRLSRELIAEELLPRFGDGPLAALPDGALLSLGKERLIFTTDSFVVQPLEFPGGNIGHLAVHGTVNDIAAAGGRPLWLSFAMILEEGLDFALLRRVLDAVKEAASSCGVQIVTGDTKVVARGQCDGIYLNTAGIGAFIEDFSLSPRRIAIEDRVLVSGPLGDHGMAVMSARESIAIQGDLVSDSAPVHRLSAAAAGFGAAIRFLRDPTRGGVAAVLGEIVEGRAVGIVLDEPSIPFSPGARAIAEMLGLDLLHVASEGRLCAICAAEVASELLASWRALPEGRDAAIIGRVSEDAGRVIMETGIGGRRLVDLPRGELLPRIC